MGFEQFLWYAENMVRVIRFELYLGVLLGAMGHEKAARLISKYEELRRRIGCMREGSELFKHGPVC